MIRKALLVGEWFGSSPVKVPSDQEKYTPGPWDFLHSEAFLKEKANARRAKIVHIRGKGRTETTKYLNEEARNVIADYLEHERILGADEHSRVLFLTALNVPERKIGGRLHVRSINRILEQRIPFYL